MKSQFSRTLNALEPQLLILLNKLEEKFDYVSILASDTCGSTVRASQRNKAIRDYMLAERGCVIRVFKDQRYSEYSLNPDDWTNPEALAEKIIGELEEQFEMLKALQTETYKTPMIIEEELSLLEEKEVQIPPEKISTREILERLAKLSDEGVNMDKRVLEFGAAFSLVHVSKMFLSRKRNLKQSYIYSEGSLMALVRQGNKTQSDYRSYSGLKGAELLSAMESDVKDVVESAIELLSAERPAAGEYDIITAPEVSGLIAHEAFGHGVEMDMFVKNRALGQKYLGQKIASELVSMHEGALAAESTSSYAFDDEGVLAGDVTEIENGILKTGIADTLSALRLKIKPTGNGKRESFERKAYTRMTSTIFQPGSNTLEEMIASIQFGYLLEGMQSGMEDPKHWGIQCMLTKGREIKDGKLTGKIVSPVILTGYVPDLLKSISMAGSEIGIEGGGYCGKGHKEWVKTADGGPYLKAKGRLG